MPNNDILPNTNINLADWWEVPASETLPAGRYAYSCGGDHWCVVETLTDLPPHYRLDEVRYFTPQRPKLPSKLGSRIYNVEFNRRHYDEGYLYLDDCWILLRKGGYDIAGSHRLTSWTLTP